MGMHPTIAPKTHWLPDPFFDLQIHTCSFPITLKSLSPREMLSEEYGFSDEAEEMFEIYHQTYNPTNRLANEKTGYK